jgi:hypothetical protein
MLSTSWSTSARTTRQTGVPWKKWGPYLSERQWGTGREDYRKDGNAWSYFSHDRPVWMPVNTLIVRALLNLYAFYGKDFTVECPTGSGCQMNLFEVAEEITRRLAGTFRRNGQGQRPVYGGTTKLQNDPHWRDLILFYEYFHGDNGAGLGASHQTGGPASSHCSSTFSARRRNQRPRIRTGPAAVTHRPS